MRELLKWPGATAKNTTTSEHDNHGRVFFLFLSHRVLVSAVAVKAHKEVSGFVDLCNCSKLNFLFEESPHWMHDKWKLQTAKNRLNTRAFCLKIDIPIPTRNNLRVCTYAQSTGCEPTFFSTELVSRSQKMKELLNDWANFSGVFRSSKTRQLHFLTNSCGLSTTRLEVGDFLQKPNKLFRDNSSKFTNFYWLLTIRMRPFNTLKPILGNVRNLEQKVNGTERTFWSSRTTKRFHLLAKAFSKCFVCLGTMWRQCASTQTSVRMRTHTPQKFGTYCCQPVKQVQWNVNGTNTNLTFAVFWVESTHREKSGGSTSNVHALKRSKKLVCCTLGTHITFLLHRAEVKHGTGYICNFPSDNSRLFIPVGGLFHWYQLKNNRLMSNILQHKCLSGCRSCWVVFWQKKASQMSDYECAFWLQKFFSASVRPFSLRSERQINQCRSVFMDETEFNLNFRVYFGVSFMKLLCQVSWTVGLFAVCRASLSSWLRPARNTIVWSTDHQKPNHLLGSLISLSRGSGHGTISKWVTVCERFRKQLRWEIRPVSSNWFVCCLLCLRHQIRRKPCLISDFCCVCVHFEKYFSVHSWSSDCATW